MTSLERIKQNVEAIRVKIAEAARRSGRSGDDVTLVAVTKYSDIEQTRLIVEAGCCDLGENRPQQLWEKASAFVDDSSVRWHQIGHLQRNKVAKTVAVIDLLHSVDSLRLLKEVDRAAAGSESRQAVLLEVNVSGDATKHGWSPDEMESVVGEAQKFENVNLRGLMTMATLGGDEVVTRRNFSDLRNLRDSLQSSLGSEFRELSMGMSGDYSIAIEEGATIVRVGSAIVNDAG